jgi:CubicO group peptidase (beta-lactamase class C family)
MRQFTVLSTLLSLLAVVSAQGQAGNLQGFTKEGIDAIHSTLHKWVDDKKGANVVTLLARKGHIVDHDAYGVLDISSEAKVPAKKDTIFRIASMTKPTVGVAMMMMYEDGRWKLDDLVSKHIPEFANLQVKLANGTSVPQQKPMTMAQLVSHSAGFPGQLSVQSATLQGIIPPLVKGELAFQPGTDWRYGPGVEIQGYLVERWAGKDLSDFLQERLFKPLGMVDTGFFIDASKSSRVSKIHSMANGTLASQPSRIAITKPARLSPSGGLYSTAEDYFKFCQMLLNNGEVNGKRYLKAESVKLMHTNNLENGVSVKMGAARGGGIGFGVDFAIVLDPKPSNNAMPKESYYWGGAYGTWFWIDPTNEVVFVGMIQNQNAQSAGTGSLHQISAKGTYAALRQ